MKNICIAQIGQGEYKLTEYESGEKIDENGKWLKNRKTYSTGYTFDAVIRSIAFDTKKQIDYLILIGTKDSLWTDVHFYYWKRRENIEENLNDNLFERFKKQIEISAGTDIAECLKLYDSRGKLKIKVEGDSDQYRLYLEGVLTEYLKDELNQKNLSVKLVVTKYGVNIKELNDNFEHLKEVVEMILNQNQSDEYGIYFDISNGFRSIPMYIYTFVNYLLRIRNEKFKLYTYYGMADAKYEYENIAPIVNLDSINHMMAWINAANEFHNFGSVRELVKLLGETDSLGAIFNNFDYASNANNLKVLKFTIEEIADLKSNHKGGYQGALLQKIGEEFTQEFDQSKRNIGLSGLEYSYSYLTIHLARWFMNQGRIGNAAVALQEGITTFLMERFEEESKIIIRLKEQNKEENDTREDYSNDRLKWLFEYKNRNHISSIFKIDNGTIEEKVANDQLKTIFDKMNAIRIYIRNADAHIMLTDISTHDISVCKSALIDMIEFMIRMVSDSPDYDKEIELQQILKNSAKAKETKKSLVSAYLKEITDEDHIGEIAHQVVIEDLQLKTALENFEEFLKVIRKYQYESNVSNETRESIEADFINWLSSKIYLQELLLKIWQKETIAEAKQKRKISNFLKNGKKSAVKSVIDACCGNNSDKFLEVLEKL